MGFRPDRIVPDWGASGRVRACVTTRDGGISRPPFDSFNLGNHVGDHPEAVEHNRKQLASFLRCSPAWLDQVHGIRAVQADPSQEITADASWTEQAGVACTIMTADCLPVLFCNYSGTCVAAAHAGWRGLLGGVLESALEAMPCSPGEVMAWLGPAIGPQAFEVGSEVWQAFTRQDPDAEQAFISSVNPDRFLADIYYLARLRLHKAGVTNISGGGFCTLTDPRFFSFRRSSRTGRQAALIWLEPLQP